MENGNSVEASTSAAAQQSNNGTSSSNGASSTTTPVKLDGLAVTMDGKETEADDVNMLQTGKTSEEQQDAAAQDLNERRQSQLRKQNKFTKTSVLIPPENFAIVEDGLYRSVSTAVFLRINRKSCPQLWLTCKSPHRANLPSSTSHSYNG